MHYFWLSFSLNFWIIIFIWKSEISRIDDDVEYKDSDFYSESEIFDSRVSINTQKNEIWKMLWSLLDLDHLRRFASI